VIVVENARKVLGDCGDLVYEIGQESPCGRLGRVE
jgi:hypothetical protein